MMSNNNRLNASDLGDRLQALASAKVVVGTSVPPAVTIALFRLIAVKPNNSRLRNAALSRFGSGTTMAWWASAARSLGWRLGTGFGGCPRPAVWQSRGNPQFSPLATAPLPELDRPLQPRQNPPPAGHPAGCGSRSSGSTPCNPDRALQRTGGIPVPEPLSQQRWSTAPDGAHPSQSVSLRKSGRSRSKAPQWRCCSSGLGSSELDVQGCISEAVDRTVSHLDYRPIETGSYRVCFTPEIFFLCSVPSAACSMRSVLDGVSLSQRDSIGSDVAVLPQPPR